MPGRPATSIYLRSSMVPSVPTMKRRPSPQVERPSGVNQSTRHSRCDVRRAQVEIAVILQAGRVGIGAVRDGRGQDLGFERASEEEELLALMRGDVGDDAAASACGRRTTRAASACAAGAAQTGGVDDLADGPGLDQFAGLDGRGGLEMFGIERWRRCAGLGLHPAHLGRADPASPCRPVEHRILAVAHGIDWRRPHRSLEIAALTIRSIDAVLEDSASCSQRAWCLRKTARRRRPQGRPRARVEGDQFGAPAPSMTLTVAVDVIVVETDGGKAQGAHQCYRSSDDPLG